MAAKYLLDSVILIDHLNGVPGAGEWIKNQAPNEMAISVITRAEVLSKTKSDWDAITAFLEEFSCFSIGPDEADLAAGFRNRYRLKLPDAFQAAIAHSEDLTLVTRDRDDFKKVEDLEVKIPYQV